MECRRAGCADSLRGRAGPGGPEEMEDQRAENGPDNTLLPGQRCWRCVGC